MKPLVLVVGTGCCGTSKVADVLWRNRGVCFTHAAHRGKMARGDKPNHSDPALRKAVKLQDPKHFHKVLAKKHRDCDAPYWGHKSIELADMEPGAFQRLGAERVIEPWRPRGSCLRSWRKFNARESDETLAEWYDRRTRNIKRLKAQFPGKWSSVMMDPEQWVWTDEELLECIWPEP